MLRISRGGNPPFAGFSSWMRKRGCGVALRFYDFRMFFATALDGLLQVSPLLFLGAVVLAFIYVSLHGETKAGCLMMSGLGLGGFAGWLMLGGGGGKVWGSAALLGIFSLPLFGFVGLSAGIFVSALRGRQRGWALVTGIPLAGLGLLLASSAWGDYHDAQKAEFWRKVLGSNEDSLPRGEYLRHVRRDMGFLRHSIGPATSPKLLKIVLEVWPEGCAQIASLPNIDQEIIEGILRNRWGGRTQETLRNLAANPKVPEEILFSLVDGGGLEAPDGVADNPAATPRCLRAAFQSAAALLSDEHDRNRPAWGHDDARFHSARSRISSAGPKLWEKDALTAGEWNLLATHGDASARKFLASRPEAPVGILEILTMDEEGNIREKASEQLANHPGLSGEERSAWKDRTERSAIARVVMAGGSESRLRDYLRNGSRKEKETAVRILVYSGESYLAMIRSQLALDPKDFGRFLAAIDGLPPQVYRWLADSRHADVRVAAQEKLKTSADTNEKELRILVRTVPVPDLLIVVSSLGHSHRLLELLAAEPDSPVSERAKKRLAGSPD